ncbi:hypothetical protein LMH87_011514 [Akanthomyces muscarius]|uniref:Uncharacterized protein n=1 Tax=Akanthomyces muscarius TaxID=2231603 RepID=A0A9W8Q9C2_AKAMU|nr:hypothetical protein LMH87_011514 [Akanthomyces muscarius]KAJ4150779.1 hypothetical protein LMH87_011514 [Akanthomyces muscarius]
MFKLAGAGWYKTLCVFAPDTTAAYMYLVLLLLERLLRSVYLRSRVCGRSSTQNHPYAFEFTIVLKKPLYGILSTRVLGFIIWSYPVLSFLRLRFLPVKIFPLADFHLPKCKSVNFSDIRHHDSPLPFTRAANLGSLMAGLSC